MAQPNLSPTPEEISERAYLIYLKSWEDTFSVEHILAAEKELIEEYAKRESAPLEPKSVTPGHSVSDRG